MKARDLIKKGIPPGEPVKIAIEAIRKGRAAGVSASNAGLVIDEVVRRPVSFLDDPVWGDLARAVTTLGAGASTAARGAGPAPYRIWGEDIEPEALDQLKNAAGLPVATRAALMPDAHVGYGLPIGGVLATRNAVIPYAVGVDIACRMKLSVFDIPLAELDTKRDRFRRALAVETSFGVGAEFGRRRHHPVMDENWAVSAITKRLKDRAWSQLGTSGSGNHFVEFGSLTVTDCAVGMDPGVYLALLSHSGSRGVGNQVATHYSLVAMKRRPSLPREQRHLAWLDLDTEEGMEYWSAMQLMGRYAAANHALIHSHVAANLGAQTVLDIENHHNFAWREHHFAEEVVVHRKGATPAALGVLGVIPGSMATPGFVVRGRGNEASLSSASHGAGRRMSRKEAKKRFTWDDTRTFLDRAGVEVIAAGLDEAPMAYKDIEAVMSFQQDLVEPLARFDPRMVRMAPGHERPED